MESFRHLDGPTKIITPSDYTFDLSNIGIEGGVALCTSICKHETPFRIFVGIRGLDWVKQTGQVREYTLRPLGRELTPLEKNQIYDLM